MRHWPWPPRCLRRILLHQGCALHGTPRQCHSSGWQLVRVHLWCPSKILAHLRSGQRRRRLVQNRTTTKHLLKAPTKILHGEMLVRRILAWSPHHKASQAEELGQRFNHGRRCPQLDLMMTRLSRAVAAHSVRMAAPRYPSPSYRCLLRHRLLQGHLHHGVVTTPAMRSGFSVASFARLERPCVSCTRKPGSSMK